MGVLANCINAGHANCAMAAFMPGVEATKSGMEGAINGGILKDAKIVMLSRKQKSVNDVLGILGGWFAIVVVVTLAAVAPAVPVLVAVAMVVGAAEGWHWVDGLLDGPNSFANRASLYTQMAIFTVVVVRNFAVPGVTVAKGWLRRVDVTVSMALAVKYVPVYKV
jgi:hypothetical protein